MNSSQQGILWIGIIVVLVFLFTDQNFRNQLFGRGSAKPATAPVPYTAAQIFGVAPSDNKTILAAMTGQSSTPGVQAA